MAEQRRFADVKLTNRRNRNLRCVAEREMSLGTNNKTGTRLGVHARRPSIWSDRDTPPLTFRTKHQPLPEKAWGVVVRAFFESCLTVVAAGWVNAVLVGDHLPELGTNLVTTLPAWRKTKNKEMDVCVGDVAVCRAQHVYGGKQKTKKWTFVLGWRWSTCTRSVRITADGVMDLLTLNMNDLTHFGITGKLIEVYVAVDPKRGSTSAYQEAVVG